MSFRFYSPISINAAQVPSTQSNFPVLVSQIDNRFKTVGNNGHVNNSNGFDIRPYSDSALTTPITGYELERYNASTGEVIMWVKVSSLSSSTTPIYLAYGDFNLNTDGSSSTTWSNGFIDVYHLKDGTTLTVNSATGTHNGTNHGATAAAGQVDGGALFASASSQYIDTATFAGPAAITCSAWANPSSFTATETVFNRPGDFVLLKVNTSAKLIMSVVALGGVVGYSGTGSHALSTVTWYYLTLTYDSSSGLVGYVNAASDNTVVANGTLNQTQHVSAIGSDRDAGDYWNGIIDEVRLANVARSADWITTEYNNQSAPATFETLGSEVDLGPSGLFTI